MTKESTKANKTKVKIFANFDYELENLETEINKWLSDQPAKTVIHDILYQYAIGSDSAEPGDPGTGIFTFTVVYGEEEAKSRARAK